jgi:ATP-dependent DNA helicase
MMEAGKGRPETMAESAAALLRLESERIEVVPSTAEGRKNVLSNADLDVLLDRSPAVFQERGSGWVGGASTVKLEGEENSKKAGGAFAVFDAPTDHGNEALANMLGEEMDE